MNAASMTDQTAVHPIDAAPSVPPPKGTDREYITRDISAALERAVEARIDSCAAITGIGRRAAAARVLVDLYEPPLSTFCDERARWSAETFGSRELGQRTGGILKHLEKELREIEKDPTDLEEWIDVVLLALDGAWRSAGADGKAIVSALLAKHAKNIARKWPAPTSLDEPIEHVRDDLDERLGRIVDSVRR